MSDILLDPNAPTAPQGEVPALDLGPGATPTAPAAASVGDVITDTNTEKFMVDVIEPSQTVPVIIYFWSVQSEPSLQMMPVLEKLVKRAGGLVKLAKICADQCQDIVQQMRVQTIPTVYAFKEGRPVDAFADVQGEAQIQSFIDKLIGDAKPPIDLAMEQATDLMAAGEPAQAEDVYTAILGQDETFNPALAGMIRAISAQGEFDRATDILDSLEYKTRHSVEIEQAVSAMELAQQAFGSSSIDTAELEAKVAANTKDLDARHELALAFFAQARHEDAIEQLLEIVRIDREWNDAAGRKQLIKIFDTLGGAHPLTQDARRRLSAVLFS